jgi:hypothetical protein
VALESCKVGEMGERKGRGGTCRFMTPTGNDVVICWDGPAGNSCLAFSRRESWFEIPNLILSTKTYYSSQLIASQLLFSRTLLLKRLQKARIQNNESSDIDHSKGSLIILILQSTAIGSTRPSIH